MNLSTEARVLADYVLKINLWDKVRDFGIQPYSHIGALYTNITLQSGMNYRSVVEPRVRRVELLYPEAFDVDGFSQVISKFGVQQVIGWYHHRKIEVLFNLLNFSVEFSINTCIELTQFLKEPRNQRIFLSIDGIGNKTLDYTLQLLSFDNVAVDRHIVSFVKSAGVKVNDYGSTKTIVEFAADLLDLSRVELDRIIWNYMSSRASSSNYD